MLYLKKLSGFYISSEFKDKNKTSKQGIMSNLINAIHLNWLEKDSIQSETEILMKAKYESPVFLSISNICGCVYLTSIILILSL